MKRKVKATRLVDVELGRDGNDHLDHHRGDTMSASHRTQCSTTKRSLDDDHSNDDPSTITSCAARRESESTLGLPIQRFNKVFLTRLAVVGVWVSAAVIVAFFAHKYNVQHNTKAFEDQYYSYAAALLRNLDTVLDRKLVAFDSLATTICVTAHATNQSFPFVTIPNFALLAANTRVQAQVMSLAWLPLVTEDNRRAWQDYALSHRMEAANLAHDQDEYFRIEQDIQLGYSPARRERPRVLEGNQDYNGNHTMALEEEPPIITTLDPYSFTTVQVGNDSFEVVDNVLQDGTDYHYQLYNFKTGIRPLNTGPYFPNWQRSPVNAARQSTLNVDYASFEAFEPTLKHLLSKQEINEGSDNGAFAPSSSWGATINNAITVKPHVLALERENLLLSQYRHNVDTYLVEPKSSLTYPVLDYADWRNPESTSRGLVGLLTMPIYWRLYFENILPETAQGVIVIVENSFNQTFSYRVDGSEASFLGFEDPRRNVTITSRILPGYQVTQMLQSSGQAETLSYKALQLDTEYSTYTISVFATQDTANIYMDNNDSRVYITMVAIIFAMALCVFLCFDYFVRQRQTFMMAKDVQHARKAASVERELNEFIAHEVRNPLSAALSACSFVSSALNDESTWRRSGATSSTTVSDIVAANHQRDTVIEDVSIINSSLKFINDLLRNMLDLHRAQDHELTVKKLPIDLYKDVLEPVATILYGREKNYEIYLECHPYNLLVETDCLRLTQIMMNLGRNASKFVDKGYIKLRADIFDDNGTQTVRLYVEDSGPGISVERRSNLFDKYQESLDLLSQGTGIGLCLCKHLVTILGGEIWLDDDFESGVDGNPGTRFIVDLKTPPLAQNICVSSLDDTTQSFHPQKSTTLSTKTLHSKEEAQHGQPTNVQDNTPPMLNNSQNDGLQATDLAQNLSVLFVDDDTIQRKLFRRTIKRLMPSWKVDEAANGETAIQKAAKGADGNNELYDIIFMDQYMASTQKQLLGTEATRELRSAGFSNLICGLSANDCEKAFLNAGADAFWFKPITTNNESLRQELIALFGLRN